MIRTPRATTRRSTAGTALSPANGALVRARGTAPGQRVLDFAAGPGAPRVALDVLGRRPRRLRRARARDARSGNAEFDSRVRWIADFTRRHEYDRILCGAAIWQMPDLDACIEALAQRLAPGGALSFNIPAAYPRTRPPWRGPDPLLTQLPGALARLRASGDSPAAASVALVRRQDVHAAFDPHAGSCPPRGTSRPA